VTSNTASISWIIPAQPISTSTVWAQFFPSNDVTYGNPGSFTTTPDQTPVFTQSFPQIDFDPPPGTVPGNTSGVDYNTRPFTDVLTDGTGAYRGTLIAQGTDGQGQHYQAGVGALDAMQVVFTGDFLVAQAGDLTFTLNLYTDDGFLIGVGNGASPGGGIAVNLPPSGVTPFEQLPLMGGFNSASYPARYVSLTVHFPGPGSYPYELDYFECCSGGLSITMTATPTGSGSQPIPVPEAGTLALTPVTTSSQPAGTSRTFTVAATDAAGNALSNLPVQFTVTGANPQQLQATTDASGTATFQYTGALAGTDTVQALAWLSNSPVYSNGTLVPWSAPASPPPTPPIATPGWIGSPASQSTQTGSVPITLANGITLSSGTVDYWPTADSSAVTTLATNVSGTGGATLATLDTTTLANGSYIVRLQGTDNTGTQLNSEILLTVAGQNKPGRVTFSVTDLTVPVTGMPITIGRTYDSLLRSQSGDFGNGWNLTIGSPRLSVDPAHNVSLTLPDGRQATFFFTPQSVGGIFGFLSTPGYTPEAGVFGSLTSDGCGLLAISNGQYFCFLNGQYQPSTYTYTDPYGRAYVMDATGALKSITDLDGNTLTFTPTGITSSAGNLHVAFTRDSAGRITQITDPEGNVYQYSYDGAGNLMQVTLPGGGSTPITLNYTYDSSHLLKTETDPLGHTGVTTTYYPDGRLQSVTDAGNNTTSYAYPAPNTTAVTAPDGGVTTYTYDASGDLLSQTDSLGQQTTYTYDSQHNLTSVTDPLGHKTTYTYDSQGNRTSMTDPLHHTISATYNAFGGPTPRAPSGASPMTRRSIRSVSAIAWAR
jgi:YD repeat-containing protein